MMDAAVVKEAYDETEEDLTTSSRVGMENANWLNYDRRLWCSYWFSLFRGSNGLPTTDNRSRLTWGDRLSRVLTKVESFNFYSSGEEVLRNPSGVEFVPLTANEVWNNQERLKGMSVLENSWVLTHEYGGWQLEYYRQHQDMATLNQLTNAELIQRPLFDSSRPHDLYGSTGSDYAADAAQRNTLLAEMVPCLSFCAGSNPLRKLDALFPGSQHNFDMQTLHDGWPDQRTDGNAPIEWHHSDFKEVAYAYTHKLYEKYVSIAQLNR